MSVLRIALTTGEPAGIGPDLAVQVAQRQQAAELVALGDPDLLAARARLLGLPLRLRTFDPARQPGNPPRPSEPGELCVMPVTLAAPVTPGRLDPRNAEYVLSTLRQAAQGCLDRRFDAMVTAPVQKSVINDAGIAFSGHTEFLAGITAARTANHAAIHTNTPLMMLACETMRVALLTTHLPLAEVPAAVTPERLESALTVLHDALNAHFGIAEPVIAVLGLNPHAGEAGHLGREEIDIIEPTLEKLRRRGLALLGPLPADTAFNPSALAQADAVLAMYHDQGLPALKHAAFGAAANITLGLPILRTSVDHGTALDIAGSGRADLGGLEYALHCAIALAS